MRDARSRCCCVVQFLLLHHGLHRLGPVHAVGGAVVPGDALVDLLPPRKIEEPGGSVQLAREGRAESRVARHEEVVAGVGVLGGVGGGEGDGGGLGLAGALQGDVAVPAALQTHLLGEHPRPELVVAAEVDEPATTTLESAECSFQLWLYCSTWKILVTKEFKFIIYFYPRSLAIYNDLYTGVVN